MGEIQGRNLEEESMEECSLLAHSLNHALLAEFLIQSQTTCLGNGATYSGVGTSGSVN